MEKMKELLHLPDFCIDQRTSVDLGKFRTDLGDEIKKNELKESLDKDKPVSRA